MLALIVRHQEAIPNSVCVYASQSCIHTMTTKILADVDTIIYDTGWGSALAKKMITKNIVALYLPELNVINDADVL